MGRPVVTTTVLSRCAVETPQLSRSHCFSDGGRNGEICWYELEADARFQGNGTSSGKSSTVMQNVVEIGATVYKCAKNKQTF
jgi:hypothetical protein